jgi:hypothetical protein
MRQLMIGLCLAGMAANACSRPEATGAADTHEIATATTGSVRSAPDKSADRLEWREVVLPAGTQLAVVLDSAVSSSASHTEDRVEAHLARAVSVQGELAVPDGSLVSGIVTDATRSAKVKGRAHVALRFNTLIPRGGTEHYTIATTAVGRTAQTTKQKDAITIGAPALGGAIIGGLFGGKKGAAIGTAAGGGAGTGVVLSTRGKEVSLPIGTALTLRLTEPLTLRVRS